MAFFCWIEVDDCLEKALEKSIMLQFPSKVWLKPFLHESGTDPDVVRKSMDRSCVYAELVVVSIGFGPLSEQF